VLEKEIVLVNESCLKKVVEEKVKINLKERVIIPAENLPVENLVADVIKLLTEFR
jgi:hypothetical protein